jgi:hypothetical protein
MSVREQEAIERQLSWYKHELELMKLERDWLRSALIAISTHRA